MNSNTAGQDGLIPKPREFNHCDIAINHNSVFGRTHSSRNAVYWRLYRDWAEEPWLKFWQAPGMALSFYQLKCKDAAYT